MAKPDVFADVTFEVAVERSRIDSRVLIVDAMATWCGPCATMDRTTWVDPAVVARLSTTGGAFAIQVDVDAETAVAARLEVRAMPTLIAFRDGLEHDRVVGGRPAAALLEWLDIVERGERFEDAQRAARVALEQRRVRATDLLRGGRYADATPEYLWLWSNTRVTEELAGEATALATAHEPARAAFRALREAATPRDATLEALVPWLVLGRIVGDRDATLAWYDANATMLPSGRAVALVVEAEIVPLLMSGGRWREVGALIADPVNTWQRRVDGGARGEALRVIAGQLARALYAAGRDERADDLEFEARAVDRSAEMMAALAEAKRLGREDRAAPRPAG